MARRRIINSVLHNFLATFTSRNSDFNGYWLFGFLVDSLDGMNIDLMGAPPENTASAPSDFARRLAAQKFAEQVAKACLPITRFRSASLQVTKSPTARLGAINGHICSGIDVRFLAHAVTDFDRTHDSTLSIFVAPHDPTVERRRARAL
jgi:hypothetical protein